MFLNFAYVLVILSMHKASLTCLTPGISSNATMSAVAR